MVEVATVNLIDVSVSYLQPSFHPDAESQSSKKTTMRYDASWYEKELYKLRVKIVLCLRRCGNVDEAEQMFCFSSGVRARVLILELSREWD